MESKELSRNGCDEKRKGGIKTMPFIFANEISEKLAVVGLAANMVSYLTQQLHLPAAQAAATVTNFGGTASLTPLLGAFLADAYVGRFYTIAAASFIYLIGMSSLTASAVLPWLRPPPCPAAGGPCVSASSWQMTVLYASLLLAALGAGGIRPCVVAFGAEQFPEKERKKTWSFFNWYYFCMGTTMVVAVTAVVYVQDNVGWGWGLGIPTVAMGISLVSFAAGFPIYRMMPPAGSPFTRLAQVAVAAVKKRKLPAQADPGLLYQNDELDAPISLAGKLVHTNGLSFLDKAAIISEEDGISSSGGAAASAPDLWRLSTVHRVEELKSLIRMAPIWAAGVLVITASSQLNTFFLQQARAMDRRLSPSSSFLVPPGSMAVFYLIPMLSTIALYDRLFVPLARRLTGLDRGISFLLRMGIGFCLYALGTLLAGFIEIHRRHTTSVGGPGVSVFWLVPQYAMFGVAEAFTSIGHLEFFYDQSPESMRSTAAALFWMSISAGSYTNSLLVTAVHRLSSGGRGAGTGWLPDDLNRGRLEYFYWVIAGLQVVNLVYYVWCARRYIYKPLKMEEREAAVETMTKV
ncbi:putative nitrite transporter [Apostasia shenzhenica]|uniref:Putative nitrite transporter n=1 Tax=Apostasia shenzhenica TaxID=1088818 RepID=A0A2I0BBK2_9ASPA|nr:putative nitrite transporter [Apostasia shenzhenica]